MGTMCGRYATSRTRDQLVDDFAAGVGDLFSEDVVDYNLAPTKSAPLVIGRADDEHGVRRELVTARWGLVPAWAKDPSIGSRLINARSETVATKRAFARAFAVRRAIVPADGFYEWFTPTKGPKQPFFVTREGGLALAGLYEFSKDAEDRWRVTFTILTTSATGTDGRLHDRAPLLVGADLTDRWLAPEPDPDLLERLVPATPGRLETWPVDRAVGRVANNGPGLVQPIELDEALAAGPE